MWKRPTRCILFLNNLFQLNYPGHVSYNYLFIIRMSVQAAYSNLPCIFMRSLVADTIRLVSLLSYSTFSVFFTYMYHDARLRECEVRNSHEELRCIGLFITVVTRERFHKTGKLFCKCSAQSNCTWWSDWLLSLTPCNMPMCHSSFKPLYPELWWGLRM
jgi:hypothetical protein